MACTDVIWRVPKERIKPHVIVRSVKAGVIEQVERLKVEAKFEAFSKLDLLEHSHVHARLEGTAEYIASSLAEASLVDIASPSREIAGRDAILSWLK